MLHVLGDDELRTRARASGGHVRLVRAQDVHELVRDRISGVLELGLVRSLDGLVGEERGERDGVDRAIDLGDAAGCRNRLSDHANPPLTGRRGVQDGSLEDDERRVERLPSSVMPQTTSTHVFNLDFDCVRLIGRDRRQREQVRRPDEEVAVEGRHPESCVRQPVMLKVYAPLVARTRMTASSRIGCARTSLNS